PKKDKIINIVKDQDKVFYPPSLLKELYPLSTSAAPCPSSLMIRKAAMLKHGGFEEHFTGKYQLYEDQAFLHKIYLEEPVFISSLCNNKYRQRFGSLVQKIKQEGNYHVVRLYFLEWLEKYMQQKNIQDPAIHQLLKKAFKPYRSPILYRIQILPGQVLDSLRIFKQWLIKAFFL
ncbi:MAG TPA: hypothetical protein VF610_10720, partial [Segetibacter sp.]